MTTFQDLGFTPDNFGGVSARVAFNNGYGASVIKGPYSYGGNEGLYELAVLHGELLCYDTPITGDVVGHLSEEEVTQLLSRIEGLNSL